MVVEGRDGQKVSFSLTVNSPTRGEEQQGPPSPPPAPVLRRKAKIENVPIVDLEEEPILLLPKSKAVADQGLVEPYIAPQEAAKKDKPESSRAPQMLAENEEDYSSTE